MLIALAGHVHAQPAPQPPPDKTTPGGIYDPNMPPPPEPVAPSEPPPPANPPPQPYPPPQPSPPPQPYPPQQPYPPPYAVAPQPPPKKEPDHLICFFGRPHECSSVMLLEVGARGDKTRTVTSVDVGLLVHNGYDAYGATVGVIGIEGGNAKGDGSVWYAGRYRRYLGRWGLAADVSAGYADGLAFDVAIGWGDVIALTAGVNQFEVEGGGNDWVASAGFRIGSVTIGGLFYLAIIGLSSGR